MTSKETKSTLSVLLYLIFILSPLLIASSATATESEQEYAKYIEDWSFSIDGFEELGCSDDDYLIYENSILGIQCSGRQFDDQGNTYVALYSRYSSTSFGGISFSSGFNIVKIAADGNIESNTVISQSGGSTSTSNRVLSFNVISEDVYYFSFNSYHSNNQWEFSSSVTAQNTGSNQEIISYYDSGWQWAINAGSSSRTYDGGEVNTQGNTDWAVSSDGDLITLNYHDYDSNGNSQCYGQLTIEYRLQKYSASDGSIDWYRTIETCYGIYNNLFTDGTDILVYFDSLGPNVNIHGDSLDCEGTIGIGSGTYTGCHLFAKFSNSGQTLWSQTVDHTGVFFTKFKPVSSGILLAGHWQITWDFDTQNFTDFSGDITWGPFSGDEVLGVSIAKMDLNGNWVFSHSWSGSEDELGLLARVSFDEENDFIITIPFEGSSFAIDSTHTVTHNTAGTTWNTVLFAYSSTGQYQWSTMVYGQSNNFLYGFAISGDNGMVSATGSNSPVYFGDTYADMMGSNISLAWFDVDDGTWVDFSSKSTNSYIIYGANSEHSFLAASEEDSNYFLQVHTLDVDADDIPPSIDNCVDDWNPTQADHDLDGIGDACDDDDDDDQIPDDSDLCPRGVLNWESTAVLDHDGDGCLDDNDEDRDDDNDGHSDQSDLCPVGMIGLGGDTDDDGCKDDEDSDDDNDGILDGSDYCPRGNTGWMSGEVTDHDSDGCQDTLEDFDDDDDGVPDTDDFCPKGELDWTSNTNTDFDNDGCQDGVEDEDNDNDGIPNPSDECPYSVGNVDSRGCTPEQATGGDNSGGDTSPPVIYYVCSGGSAVVLDLADCPEDNENNSQNEQQENTTEQNNQSSQQNQQSQQNQSTLQIGEDGFVVTGGASLPDGFILCPSGKAIVTELGDCPEARQSEANTDQSSSASSSDGANNSMMMWLFAATLLFSVISVIISVFRRQSPSGIPGLVPPQSFEPLPGVYDHAPELEDFSPPLDQTGVIEDGYEWVEWPSGTGERWYRKANTGGDWNRWK